MESTVVIAQRLLAALEELVMQETVFIRTMDFIEAVTVRERAAPLVEKLCSLADELSAGSPAKSDPLLVALYLRLDGVITRSMQNHHFLDQQLARLQVELDRVNEARGRLNHVAPVYKAGRTAPGESRLNTAA